jgi:formylglycine-generating enzyme required for sulfatase activity
MSFEDALGFCKWLNTKAADLVDEETPTRTYYRLPSAEEIKAHPASEYEQEVTSWTMEESNPTFKKGEEEGKQGIRLVKQVLNTHYESLLQLLILEDWEKSDRATTSVMLKSANCGSQETLNRKAIKELPGEDVRLIDYLWVLFSQGCDGLGIQAMIGKNLSDSINCRPYQWYRQVIGDSQSIFNALAKRFVSFGSENHLPRFNFEIITVNRRGEKILNKRHQAQFFRKYLGNYVGLEMVLIPGGTFVMGSPSGEGRDNEKPQHQVTVSSFWMGKYPITQAQWKAIASRTYLKVERDLENDPSRFKGENRPVERVSWLDAVEFCQRLSKLTGRNYQLPSEAQWEYACRSQKFKVGSLKFKVGSLKEKEVIREWNEKYNQPFHFGETLTSELANYRSESTYADELNGVDWGETTPVGQFPPNAFGLYDMHGNVWEWCQDDWHSNYEGAPTDYSNSPSHEVQYFTSSPPFEGGFRGIFLYLIN